MSARPPRPQLHDPWPASREAHLPGRSQAPTRHRSRPDPASRPADCMAGPTDRFRPGPSVEISANIQQIFRPRRTGEIRWQMRDSSAVDDGAVIRAGRLAPLGCRPGSRPRTSRNDVSAPPWARAVARGARRRRNDCRSRRHRFRRSPSRRLRSPAPRASAAASSWPVFGRGAAVGRGVGSAFGDGLVGGTLGHLAAPTPSRRAPGRSCGQPSLCCVRLWSRAPTNNTSTIARALSGPPQSLRCSLAHAAGWNRGACAAA